MKTYQINAVRCSYAVLLSANSRTRISSILDGLTENDNIILMIAPLK